MSRRYLPWNALLMAVLLLGAESSAADFGSAALPESAHYVLGSTAALDWNESHWIDRLSRLGVDHRLPQKALFGAEAVLIDHTLSRWIMVWRDLAIAGPKLQELTPYRVTPSSSSYVIKRGRLMVQLVGFEPDEIKRGLVGSRSSAWSQFLPFREAMASECEIGPDRDHRAVYDLGSQIEQLGMESSFAEVLKCLLGAQPAFDRGIQRGVTDLGGSIAEGARWLGDKAREAVPGVVQFLTSRPDQKGWLIAKGVGDGVRAAGSKVSEFHQTIASLPGAIRSQLSGLMKGLARWIPGFVAKPEAEKVRIACGVVHAVIEEAGAQSVPIVLEVLAGLATSGTSLATLPARLSATLAVKGVKRADSLADKIATLLGSRSRAARRAVIGDRQAEVARAWAEFARHKKPGSDASAREWLKYSEAHGAWIASLKDQRLEMIRQKARTADLEALEKQISSAEADLIANSGKLQRLDSDDRREMEKRLGITESSNPIFRVGHEKFLLEAAWAYMRHPHLASTGRGAFLFHGSNSASLLTFTEYGGKSGHLTPTGVLESRGKVPFSGEIVFGRKSANAEHISAASIEGIANAVRYTRGKGWTPSQGRKDIAEAAKLSKKGTPDSLIGQATTNVQEVARKRLDQWSSLTPEEQALVIEGFPVLYGVRTTRTLTPVISDISSEVGIKGGVLPNEITVIYVPKDKMDLVRRILDRSPTGKPIAVEDIDRL